MRVVIESHLGLGSVLIIKENKVFYRKFIKEAYNKQVSASLRAT